MAEKVWFFDLDDTLMNTAEVYLEQIEKAAKLMIKYLGDQAPTLAQVKQKHLEIDSALRTKINPVTRKPYYYSMERFPLSLVETYRYFCKELSLESSYMVERELFKIGEKVFLTIKEYQKKIKKEAYSLLEFLDSRSDILILLTKGDRRIQRKKFKALEREGLLKYFTKFRVVKDKNQTVFRKLKKGFSGKKFYSVGNEYRSDIEPAIKEGCFGVYIPVSSAAVWDKGKLEKIEEDRDKANSVRYGNLLEIKQKYDYL